MNKKIYFYRAGATMFALTVVANISGKTEELRSVDKGAKPETSKVASAPAKNNKVTKKPARMTFVSQAGLEKTKKVEALQKEVITKQQEYARQIQEKNDVYTTRANELSAQRSLLKPNELEDKVTEVARLKDELERFAQSAERKMQTVAEKASQEAIKCFAEAAKEYANKYDYDVVFSEMGVVFVREGFDEKEEIRSIVDKNYKIELAQNTQKTPAQTHAVASADKKTLTDTDKNAQKAPTKAA